MVGNRIARGGRREEDEDEGGDSVQREEERKRQTTFSSGASGNAVSEESATAAALGGGTLPACLARMCFTSSSRVMTCSMSDGRLRGLVETDSITRLESATGTLGLSWWGVWNRLSARMALSPFL